MTKVLYFSTTEGDTFSVAKEELERAGRHFENGNFAEALTEFQKARQVRVDILGKDHHLVSDSDYQIGVAYANAGDLPAALASYQQALALQESNLEDVHPAIGRTHWAITSVQLAMASYEEAIEAGRQAQRIYQANLIHAEPETEAWFQFHSALGSVHLKIAQALSRQYKFNDAIPDYRMSISYMEECYGSHPETITVQNELANLFEHMKLPQEALVLYQKSADMTEAVYGSESEANSDALANLGNAYIRMPDEGSNHDEALKAFRKSLEIAEKLSGSNLDKLAQRHHELGTALAEHGKHQDAIDMNKKAAELLSKLVSGKPDTRVALIHCAIAKSYGAMQQYDQAKNEFEKSLSIDYACQGGNANNTCATHVDFGMMLRVIGDPETALQNDQQALELSEKALGENHPTTAICHYNIGHDFNALEQFLESSRAYMRAHHVHLSVFGKDHDQTIAAANYAAEDIVRHARKIIDDSGDRIRAVEFFQQAANIQENALGEHQPNTANAYLNVGEQYNILGEWQESMKWTIKALESYKAMLGEDHEVTVMTGKNVALLLSNLGRTDEALHEFRKALAALLSLHGKSHLEVAETHRQIGNLLKEKQEYTLALAEFREAHQIWEDLVDSKHDEANLLAKSHTQNLFETLACLGDIDGALAELEKGKKLLLKKEQGEDLAVCWMNIGLVLSRENFKSGALQAYREADAVFTNIDDGKGKYDEHRQEVASMIASLAPNNE